MPDTAQVKRSSGSADSGAAKATAAKRKSRLLLADDHGAFRDMLTWSFEDAGWEVVAVGNGKDLREMITSSLRPDTPIEPFDVVVTDVRMPGWTGLHAIESLSGVPEVPPVVVMTAFGDDETKNSARRAGAVAVLDKPIDPADLCALVQGIAR